MEDTIGEFKKYLIENGMVVSDTSSNSNMYSKKKPEALPMIEKLINFKWSTGKKMQRESANCFKKLAESDDKISNKFLKEVDGFCSKLKEKYLGESGYNFIHIK